MSTIADKIETLFDIKSDIKNAIIEKGVQANDDFTTYADDIAQISGGSVNPLEDNAVWQAWNYKANNDAITSATTFNKTYQNTTTIQYFLRVKLTSSSGNFEYMFDGSSTAKIQSIYLDVVGDYMASASYMCTSQKDLIVSQINYDWFNNVNLMYGSCTALKFVCTDEVKATTCESMFYGCTNLLEVPTSFPNATTLQQIFRECKSLENLSISAPVADSCYQMFYQCTSLKTIQLDLGETREANSLISLNAVCYYCTSLKSIDVIMNKICSTTQNGIMLDNDSFRNCTSLVKITGLNLAYQQQLTSSNYFISSTTVRYMIAYNIGYNRFNNYSRNWNFSTYLPNWGIEDVNEPYSIGAAQSLKDSLITYSFDRASAGKVSCTLTLATAQKALLTDSEIAQITAKGYTIA